MRQKQEPITAPDTGNESKAYWEQVLKSHNLSMARGQSVGRHKAILVGTSVQVDDYMSQDDDIEGLNGESRIKKSWLKPNSATRNPNDFD